MGRPLTYCIFALLTALPLLSPAEIYRYQDETGKWHFTDDKPTKNKGSIETVEAKPVNVMAAVDDGKGPIVTVPDGLCEADVRRRNHFYRARKGYLGKKGNIIIENVGTSDSPVLVATNDFFAPISVKVWFEEELGIEARPPLPLVTELAPHSKKQVVAIKPIDPGLPWRFSYNYKTQLGKLNPKHDANCYYLPPVPADKSYRITQSFNGRFSHNHDGSRYAVDVAMEEGTPIVAARDGVIIARKTDFVLSGLTDKYKRRANSIEVLHGDGTIAVYAHLKFRTMQFYEGDEVKAGQLIGRSGNTGYSTGPHLHFVILSNQNMRMKSIPFRFLIDGVATVPVAGKHLENKPLNDN